MKKIIPFIIIIAILSLGVGLFFAWQKAKPFLKPPLTPAPTAEELLKQKIKTLSDKEVFDYWVKTSVTSTEIFYLSLDGKIFKAGEGENEEINGQNINNVQQIKPSNDGSKILIKSGGTASPAFSIFDVQTKIWQPLDAGIIAADFSPAEQKIIYLINNKTGSGDLVIKDLATKAKQKTTTIMSLNLKDFDLNWIEKDLVLLIPKPSALLKGEAWLISLKDKTIKLFTSGEGLMIDWQKNKYQGLKIIVSKKQLVMSLIDKNGQEKTLNFSTFPDKCSLADSSQLYCAIAISQSVPIQALILPDDYLKKAVYSNDIVFKIDTASPTSTPEEILFSPDEAPIDASKLTKVGNSLLFVNRYDNKLYEFNL